MATNAKSGDTTDVNASLDFLTKEEKEALLTKKMDLIRQSNKALSERYKLIEADKKMAEEAGQAVQPSIHSQILPAEGATRPRGRGRGQLYQREGNRPGREKSKSSVEFKDTSEYEPIVDTENIANYKGKGHGGSHDRDETINTRKSKRNPALEEEENSPSQHQPYRRSNESDQGSNASGRAYKGRLKDSEGPPPDPSFNPLADRRRSDKRDDFPDQKRHPRNFGGSTDLSRVKQNMRNMREKEKEGPAGSKPLMMSMTGKERKNHEQWKAERERYDKERIQRQMNDGGSWRRAWDADKVSQENDEHESPNPSSWMEHAKQTGDLQQSDHSYRQQQEQHFRQEDQHQQSQLSSHPSENKMPRGRGRGRGRVHGLSIQPGEQSSRTRMDSGDDNRLVECQKELLLVKIDNTVRDNSVEVQYDDEDFPILSSTTPKPSQAATVPGHGPTGRTSNTGSKQQRPNGKQHPQRNKTHDQKNEPKIAAQQMTVEDKNAAAAEPPYIIPDLATADHSTTEPHLYKSSHNKEDSDEWEDCTESSDTHDDDYLYQTDAVDVSQDKEEETAHNLHLECTPSSDVLELPMSPDFMKTPPGHVKVLNWAADGCPTSPVPQETATTQPLYSQEPSNLELLKSRNTTSSSAQKPASQRTQID